MNYTYIKMWSFPFDRLFYASFCLPVCVSKFHESVPARNINRGNVAHHSYTMSSPVAICLLTLLLLPPPPPPPPSLLDSKVHGANMGSIWGRQNPGGPHVGPLNFAIWAIHSAQSKWSETQNIYSHISQWPMKAVFLHQNRWSHYTEQNWIFIPLCSTGSYGSVLITINIYANYEINTLNRLRQYAFRDMVIWLCQYIWYFTIIELLRYSSRYQLAIENWTNNKPIYVRLPKRQIAAFSITIYTVFKCQNLNKACNSELCKKHNSIIQPRKKFKLILFPDLVCAALNLQLVIIRALIHRPWGISFWQDRNVNHHILFLVEHCNECLKFECNNFSHFLHFIWSFGVRYCHKYFHSSVIMKCTHMQLCIKCKKYI